MAREASPSPAAQVPKNLIVRPVFLDDVNHMLDLVLAGYKGNSVHVPLRGVHGRRLPGPRGEIPRDFGQPNARQ